MPVRDKGAQAESVRQNRRDGAPGACQYPANQSARTSDEAPLPRRGLHDIRMSGRAANCPRERRRLPLA